LNIHFRSQASNKKITLHNDLIEDLKTRGCYFQLGQKTMADALVNALTDVLWYIDPHRSKFKDRSISLPFDEFQGYNDFKAKKQARPVVSVFL
jgi:hypothetical protein